MALIAALGFIIASVTDATAATTYTVVVTYQKISFGQLADGWPESPSGFGFFEAKTSASGGGTASTMRQLGTWEKYCADFSNGSAGDPGCIVNLSPKSYNPANWYLCATSAVGICTGAGYGKNASSITLTVHPGERISLTAHIRDRDATSASDTLCFVQHSEIYSATQLDALNESVIMSQPFNGDGSCKVVANLARV